MSASATAPALLFDLGSPYAYLAVERAGAVLGVEPVLQPVVVGAMFKARGRGSWAHTDRRAENVAEIQRRAERYGLPPLRWPAAWPQSTLHAMRAALWAGHRGAGRAFAVAAFRAAFRDGEDLADHATLRRIAEVAGLDAAAMDDAIAAPRMKHELRERTDAAMAAGVTGVPTLRIGRRFFYGDDRLEDAAAALRGLS